MRDGGTAVGVDVGATLAKAAVRGHDRSIRYWLHPVESLDQMAEELQKLAPERVGLTGGGAGALRHLLQRHAARVNEFAAWGSGAEAMLREAEAPHSERYLVISVGTGTSVLLADGLSVSRIGGTALGGGTVVGLGAALVGTTRFEEIAELASRGSRTTIDLLVSDIYRAGEIPLPGDLTASNFGKLARGAGQASPEDLANAIMGLVGENVALVCGGLAAASQVQLLVFGGSTLRCNPALVEVLRTITTAMGRTPVFLPRGEFAGALGALLLASE